MRMPAPDLQRWSEELARNPASLAFLPLARAYRRQGRRDLALRVCTRGLEHHPTHVEAHALLALLHLEAGDRERAADEWSVVLRLKPGNFEALRGMGFRYLEKNDLVRARQHLERAALIRPADPAVQEALRLLRERQEAAAIASPPAPPPPAPVPRDVATRPDWVQIAPQPDTPAETIAEPDWLRPRPPSDEDFPFDVVTPVAAEPVVEPVGDDVPLLELDNIVEEGVPPGAPLGTTEALPHAVVEPEPSDAWAGDTARARTAGAADPNRIFDDLLQGTPLLGALVLDHRGLVLAGSLQRDIGGRADDLGAIIGGAIDDAARTVAHLALGEWRVMLLESEAAVIHVSPIDGRGILVLAAHRDAPTGWVMRTAESAAATARRFLEAEA